MALKLIGPHPFELDAQGQQKSRIGTLFPKHGVLYTQPPGVHAWQQSGFIELLNADRAKESLPPMTLEEEERLCVDSVDLIFDPGQIMIRPNPERMAQAFVADELLQKLVSKQKIIFLSVSDRRVSEAIRRRGELWRLSSIPKAREEKRKLVFGSKVGIGGLPIYFYNRLTGTRWLTWEAFGELGNMDDASLAQHLQEIADYSIRRNRLGRVELDFFAADLRHFGPRLFAGVVFTKLPSAQLHARFDELKQHFYSSVHEAFRRDDCHNDAWCQRIISTLFLDGNETQTEQVLSGLSTEFFMQVGWLPGGRFEEGEFLFDPIFDEAASRPEDADLQRLCDVRARGFIFNLIREYGDLDYINIGRVPESLSLARPQRRGRRGVYIAELQSRGEHVPIKRFMRLQKWGVWEHLDEGKDLLHSIEQSEEYTDFWLDRRLGCRQLGMNLPSRLVMRRLTEIYQGSNDRFRGKTIHTTYFERAYLTGIATDKLPLERFSQTGYAHRFASQLGKAAASSMIMGRALEQGKRPVFDDGDEVVREDEDGLPAEIMLGDHSGAFGEYKLPMDTYAAYYARPVNTRAKLIPQPQEFAHAYLGAFRQQLLHVQDDYRKRRRGFDALFKHCKYDTAGSFAYRWECVLRRLDHTDVEELIASIRQHIWVLNPGKAESNPTP